jgi:D-alanine-D-alanine ligase
VNVLVLHNALSADADIDEQDVLTQRDAVVSALTELGYQSSTLGCTLDLDELRQSLLKLQPDVVFNLVESLAGTDRLMPLVPLLLDSLGVPYTGAKSDAIWSVSSKVRAKEVLRAAGLPTPHWICPDSVEHDRSSHDVSRWIIKPIWEHASLAMEDDAVVEMAAIDQLETEIRSRQTRLGRPLFAEQFVDGREFNLSMLAGDVLPPAEIEFLGYPEDKPRIVGRRAKWEQDSFEYNQTPRRFDFSSQEKPLLDSLTELAKQSWGRFQMSGFARVDFRIDPQGRPWILEVNVNPCLSPDAGFAAAIERAGMSFHDAIGKIVSEAISAGTFIPQVH